MSDFVVVGKIGTTYGVLGWVKVVSFTETLTDILEYAPWYLEEHGSWKQITVQEGRAHGKGIIAKIAGFDSPEKARLLTGKKIAVQRKQFAALATNEFYWSDLEGLTVIDQHGKTLGNIIYLLETGSNDVLVVKGEREHAIPYLFGDTILQVDLDNKTMHVNWEEL